jgi:hypothetical protein
MDVAITFFLLLFPPILLETYFFSFFVVRFTTESSPGELKRVAGAWVVVIVDVVTR